MSNPEKEPETFDDSAFGRKVAAVENDPALITTKEDLVEFWKLALEERGRNREMQAYIAGIAAREIGEADIDNSRPEDNPYINIVVQLMHMDHLEHGYRDEEADQEWSKLEAMLRELPEYNDK